MIPSPSATDPAGAATLPILEGPAEAAGSGNGDTSAFAVALSAARGLALGPGARSGADAARLAKDASPSREGLLANDGEIAPAPDPADTPVAMPAHTPHEDATILMRTNDRGDEGTSAPSTEHTVAGSDDAIPWAVAQAGPAADQRQGDVGEIAKVARSERPSVIAADDLDAGRSEAVTPAPRRRQIETAVPSRTVANAMRPPWEGPAPSLHVPNGFIDASKGAGRDGRALIHMVRDISSGRPTGRGADVATGPPTLPAGVAGGAAIAEPNAALPKADAPHQREIAAQQISHADGTPGRSDDAAQPLMNKGLPSPTTVGPGGTAVQEILGRIATVRTIGAQVGAPLRTEVSLRPVELGRVAFVVGGTDGGTLSMAIIVERPETLELVRRHIDLLERAAGDAAIRLRLETATGGGSQFDPGHTDQRGASHRGEAGAGEVDASAVSPLQALHDGTPCLPPLPDATGLGARLDLRL